MAPATKAKPEKAALLRVKLTGGRVERRGDSGALVVQPEGKELELPRLEAHRLCWRGHADPVGWECPECPPEHAEREEIRLRNLARGLLTPDTRDELQRRAAEKDTKATAPVLSIPE